VSPFPKNETRKLIDLIGSNDSRDSAIAKRSARANKRLSRVKKALIFDAASLDTRDFRLDREKANVR
jgi:hypothetical protein